MKQCNFWTTKVRIIENKTYLCCLVLNAFMKHYILLIACLLFFPALNGQISHGGQPLFPPDLLRSSERNFFIEMPSFDVEEMLREDSLNNVSDMRGSFRFAKKFFTSIERGKDGLNYQLADGTKVWQVGIRSANAYSINVLFSDFHIPEGGKLFLYNSSRSSVIGSFTSENNSEDGLFPVRPVGGDEIIIEYTEPANASFEGILKITEVNHDYIDLLAYEPRNDPSASACMPDVICENPNDLNNRSAVLVVVNGTIACSGVLLSNTSRDNKSYVLTASHCLNGDFTARTADDYIKAAGSTVVFFNYNRPVCDSNFKMKGTEEMTLAGSTPVCVVDTCDITLLRFNDKVPGYYMPYYAGWNIEYNESTRTQNLTPYINMHHPQGAVGKYGISNQPLSLSSLSAGGFTFLPASHWRVVAWNTGSTGNGSSGSPLFNNRGQVVGGLTGGGSLCVGTDPNGKSDYFFALFRGWTYGNNSVNYLKSYLDPLNSGVTSMDGIDVAKDSMITLLSNAKYNSTDRLVSTTLNAPETGLLFGHNSLQETVEFAEEFEIGQNADLLGVYMMAPSTTLVGASVAPVQINVYKKILSPDNKVETQYFYPKYTTYQSGGFIDNNKSMSPNPTQSFVKFDHPVAVDGTFFVSYEIAYPSSSAFSVYNTAFGSENAKSSAWLKKTNGEWIQSENYSKQPVKTSLAIQPIIRYAKNDGVEAVAKQKSNMVRYNRTTRQLFVDAAPGESGSIEIYSITGQLIRRISYSGTSVFTIQSSAGGTIGIVRVTSEKGNSTAKIIF